MSARSPPTHLTPALPSAAEHLTCAIPSIAVKRSQVTRLGGYACGCLSISCPQPSLQPQNYPGRRIDALAMDLEPGGRGGKRVRRAPGDGRGSGPRSVLDRISVAEYESMQETLGILSDDEALADLRQSREDFVSGDTFDAAQVRAELERRRRGTS